MAVADQFAGPYELHRDYVLAVLSKRCHWLDRGDQEAVFHDAYMVLLEKQLSGELEPQLMQERQVRSYLTQTSLNKALDEAKRAERRLTTALDEQAMQLPDAGAQPDEAVGARMDAAPVREIVAELPARQLAIVKLRFYFERSPNEIQQLLGITDRTYRRQLERAMRKIAERYELVRSGQWCEDRRAMVLAYVAGLARPDRARMARAHLASCPGCARMAADLREATSKATAALPLPALVDASVLERISQAAIALRDAITEAVVAVERQVASLVRLDPSSASYAAGARPGVISAAVAACLAAGGGVTYCVVEGVPEQLRALAGVERQTPASSDPPRSVAPDPNPAPPQTTREPLAPRPTEQRPAAVATAPNPKPEQRNEEPKPAPQPEPAAPASQPEPAPPPAPEFSPEAPAASPGSAAPSADGGAANPSNGSSSEFGL